MNSSYGAIRYVDADAIGTALVNKIGGTGYAPTSWAENFDLLIPTDLDVVPTVLPDSEGSMRERYGAIELSVCDSAGAVLESKFGRKFSVGEWASVVDSMVYGIETTVSGSVISVSDAIKAPIVSWVVKVG